MSTKNRYKKREKKIRGIKKITRDLSHAFPVNKYLRERGWDYGSSMVYNWSWKDYRHKNFPNIVFSISPNEMAISVWMELKNNMCSPIIIAPQKYFQNLFQLQEIIDLYTKNE